MRKKLYITTLVIMFIFAGMFTINIPVQAASPISIFINGVKIATDSSTGEPIIVNNRTLVPVRVISEWMGMKVDWDADRHSVFIMGNSSQVGVSTLGSSASASRLAACVASNDNDITGINSILSADTSTDKISIYINGVKLPTDSKTGEPVIINNRTMVPLAAVSTGLGMKVAWDADTSSVIINSPADQSETPGTDDSNSSVNPGSDVNADKVAIMGQAEATASQLRELLQANNPDAPDLVDLYLQIGEEYGVRGDIAFCQAAKETGWWKFGGQVLPEQNNYCGLYALSNPNTGEESLNGADSSRVWLEAGKYGAFFDSPATGVEAQIQHLYAYACTDPLPAGKTLVDPRFNLVRRGAAPYWQDLGGKWAGSSTYGDSVLNDYYYQAVGTTR